MEIKRTGSQASTYGPPEWYIGTIRMDPLFEPPDPARANSLNVTFEPGARTSWHTHPSVRRSSSQAAAAGLSAGRAQSRKFGPAMWSGSRQAKSIGTARRRQPA